MFFTREENGHIARCDNPDRWLDKRYGRCKGIIKSDAPIIIVQQVKKAPALTYCSTECYDKSMKKYQDIGHPLADQKVVKRNFKE